MIEKNEDAELPIPDEWRSIITEIVEDIRRRTLVPKKISGCEVCVDEKTINYIYEVIDDYGEELISLHDSTWKTSVYVWMRGYWHLLIDLFTVGEGRSDLVLFINVYESGEAFRFEIESVHVP